MSRMIRDKIERNKSLKVVLHKLEKQKDNQIRLSKQDLLKAIDDMNSNKNN